ncbi:MAG: roadblock/LC7 domain-containing protein [Candidatus Helarchaeota archaeon]
MSIDKERQLNEILQQIKTSTPWIDGLIILSWEGLTIASNFRTRAEEELVAAMCATLISLGENSADAFKRGIFEYVFVRSKEKSVLIGKVTDEVVLTMVTKTRAKLGVLIYELIKAKGKIAEVLND